MLWAKTSQGHPSIHPLWCHLVDVAAVAGVLYEEVLEQDARNMLTRMLGVTDDAGAWLSFYAGLHDIGKASPGFQKKQESCAEALRAQGFPFPAGNPLPHGVVTAISLSEFLTNVDGFPPHSPELARRIAVAVGGHHGVFPRAEDIERAGPRAVGQGLWREARRRLAKTLANVTGVHTLRASDEIPCHSFFIFLAGLVSVADWIGSDETHFPFAEPDVPEIEYAGLARARAIKALDAIGWRKWKPPASPLPFNALFPSIDSPRPLQRTAQEISQRLDTPALVLIEAPTGEGKTEAALQLADAWSANLRQKGIYIALPTQATSNQMFSRLKDFLSRRYEDAEEVQLLLLHGHASLVAEFEAMKTPMRNIAPANIADDGTPAWDNAPANIVAGEWFAWRKRGLLAPFGVGTVDQILMAVLQTRHMFVRLFGLACKTIIIDEIHAYDTYMSTLIERLVEWLAALHCSVVLLSATLPSDRRRALLKAYQRGAGIAETHEPAGTPYPRISVVSPSGAEVLPFEASAANHRTLQIKWYEDDPANLGNYLSERLAQGGCAAVICNTVNRAQQVYQALKSYFPSEDAGDGSPELDLLHARFLHDDRIVRERRVLQRFGHPRAQVEGAPVQRPKRAVLVSTQIIEQSLDLDFDVMVSDLAPVDLLLQRAGRLCRHGRPERPTHFLPPTLCVLSPNSDADGVPSFGASAAVYEEHLLLRTWLALRSRDAVSVPFDIDNLIESVYDDRACPDEIEEAIHQRWEETRRILDNEMQRASGQARMFRILPPYHSDDILEGENRELEEDNPDVHPTFQALTRLAEPSVNVICLYGSENQTFLDADGHEAIDLAATPDHQTAMRLLRRSVSLSHKAIVHRILQEAYRPQAWVRNSLLRHTYAIFFDRCGKASSDFGSYLLRLDSELGVIVEKQLQWR